MIEVERECEYILVGGGEKKLGEEDWGKFLEVEIFDIYFDDWVGVLLRLEVGNGREKKIG